MDIGLHCNTKCSGARETSRVPESALQEVGVGAGQVAVSELFARL
jgi:hypothetical protein